MFASREIESQIWLKFLPLRLGSLLLLFIPVLCLFLGLSYDPTAFTPSLSVYIFDFDNDVLGREFSASFQREIESQPGSSLATPRFSLTIYNPLNINNDYTRVPELIRKGEVWAAISMLPNSTRRLADAVRTLGSVESQIQFLYDESRDPAAVSEYLLPGLRQILDRVISSVQRNWTSREVLKYSNNLSQLAVSAPNLLYSPITWTRVPVTEFHSPGFQTGLALSLILEFISILGFTQVHLNLLLNKH